MITPNHMAGRPSLRLKSPLSRGPRRTCRTADADKSFYHEVRISVANQQCAVMELELV